MPCLGRKTLDPSSRWNMIGLWSSSGGVRRSEVCSAASTISPVTASRSIVDYFPETGDLVIPPPPPVADWASEVSWQPIAAALLVAVMGLAALILATRARTPDWRVVAVMCAAGALAAPLLVGHTQTVQPVWVMFASDFGHLVTGAFWIGGVSGLLRYLLAARPHGGGKRPQIAPRQTTQVVTRFSRFALHSVILLAVSGAIMAILILSSWATLFTTGYGRLLKIKLDTYAQPIAIIPLILR